MTINLKTKELVSKLLESFSNRFDCARYAKYFDNNDKNLVADLCSGDELLPSPSLFEHLIKKTDNQNLLKELRNARLVSQRFFDRLFKVGILYRYDFKKFSNEFEKSVQPLGNKLIQYIQLIEYIIQSQNCSKREKLICKIKYRLLKKHIKKPEKFLIYYNLASFALLGVTSSLIFFVFGGMKHIYASSLAASISAASVISLSSYSYNTHNFNNSDISGRNNLALKYKRIFTNEVTYISSQKFREKFEEDSQFFHNPSEKQENIAEVI